MIKLYDKLDYLGHALIVFRIIHTAITRIKLNDMVNAHNVT